MSKKRKNEADRTVNGSKQNGTKKQRRDVPFHPKSSADVKRAKDYSSTDAEIAGLFEGLSNENDDKREEASSELVSRCVSAANAGESDPLHGFVDLEKPRNIYVRLIRGLCSNRKKSRDGFSKTLLRVLDAGLHADELPGVILGLILDNTQPALDALRSEKRECLVGRMTAYGALSQSTVFMRSAAGSVDDNFTKLIELMCELVTEAPHVLQELCGLSLYRVIGRLSELGASPEHFKALIQILCACKLARTPEGIAIWLEVKDKSPNTKLPKDVWHHRDPLSKHERMSLLKILRQGYERNEEDSAKEKDTSGRRQAEPSFAWGVIMRHISKKSDKPDSSRLRDFWFEAVDNSYFAETASSNRKSLGFQILIHQVKNLDLPLSPALFSPNLVKCLVNQSAETGRNLFPLAKASLSMLASRAKSDPDAALVTFKALTFRDGGVIEFDKLTSKTGAKLIQSILTNATEATTTQIVEALATAMNLDGSDDNDHDRALRQHAIAELMLHTIRVRKASLSSVDCAQETSWPYLAVRALALEACKANASPPQSLKPRLQSCLTDVISACPSEVAMLPIRLIISVHDELGDRIRVFSDASDPIKLSVKRALKLLKKLSPRLDESVPRAFGLMLSMTLLEADTGEADAIALLDEICDSYGSMELDESERVEASNEVIEILMSFASKSSSFHRKLAELVFPTFATGMSLEALRSMTDILLQKENMTGQKALFEANDDDEDVALSADADGDEHDMDSDVEEISDGGKEDVQSVASSASNDSINSENSADVRLDDALATMLGTATSVPDGDDSDSGSSMDDEEMLALEPQLAAAFRSRASAHIKSNGGTKEKSQKKQNADAKQNVLNFKNRVLDLMGLWLKQNPESPLGLHAILPLLQTMRQTASKQIAEKTANVLKTYFDSAKGKKMPVPDLTQDTLSGYDDAEPGEGEGAADDQMSHPSHRVTLGLLRAVHQEALRYASKLHAGACSRASLFLARCLVMTFGNGDAPGDRSSNGIDRMWDRITDLYADTQKTRRQNKSGLPGQFWRDYIDWDTDMLK